MSNTLNPTTFWRSEIDPAPEIDPPPAQAQAAAKEFETGMDDWLGTSAIAMAIPSHEASQDDLNTPKPVPTKDGNSALEPILTKDGNSASKPVPTKDGNNAPKLIPTKDRNNALKSILKKDGNNAPKLVPTKDGNNAPKLVPTKHGKHASKPIPTKDENDGSLRPARATSFQIADDRYFRSRRLKDRTAVEKPWLTGKRDPREKWVTIIPIMGMVIGMCIAGFMIWEGYHSVTQNKYCTVVKDEFSSGHLDNSLWSAEVGVGGHGVGSFDQTTDSTENVFIHNKVLYIRPTLQDPSLIEKDILLDLRNYGCTGANWSDCVATTNTTNGTIVNPVKSARINTKLRGSIKYGRVEVVAKLPAGDWLWPSIIMLPTNNVYGEWPQSGEIDIVQSRGNNFTYAQGGNNVIASTLHFGPNAELDGWWRNNVKSMAHQTTFSSGFHKFGVEWTPKYIFTYIDSRLLQVIYTHFNEPFWQYGKFPTADRNGTRYINPWEYGDNSTPFDQDFYLVLKVGVGSTNGWFEDNKSGKPWLDKDDNAMLRFWNSRKEWYPTWRDQGWMEIQSVKMWQQAGYKGCRLEDASRFVQ